MASKTKNTIKILIVDNRNYNTKIKNILLELKSETDISVETNFDEILQHIRKNNVHIIICTLDDYGSIKDSDIKYEILEKIKFLIVCSDSDDNNIKKIEDSVQSNYILINQDSELTIKRMINSAINEKRLICEKEQYIDSLRDMEQKYHMFIEKSRDIPYVINSKGHITYIGPQVENYGFRTYHFIGKPFASFIYEEDRNVVISNFERSITEKIEILDTFRVNTPKMGLVWFEDKSRIIFDLNDNFIMGIGILRDITERKKIEERSIQTEEKYTKIFEKANDAIFIMKDEVFTDCNSKCIILYGCNSKDEIIGKTPIDFSPEFQPGNNNSKELALKYIGDAYNEKHPVFDWLHKRKDGTLINCQVSLNRFTTNNIDYLFAILREK